MAAALAAIAALFGVLLAGFVASVLWRRRRLSRRPGVFRCNLRSVDRATGGMDPWPRRRLYAEWIHDVLLVHRGVLAGRAVALPVRFPEGVVQPERGAITRRGAGATLRLRLDNDTVVQLAATPSGRQALPGPFLAVAALDRDSLPHDQYPGRH